MADTIQCGVCGLEITGKPVKQVVPAILEAEEYTRLIHKECNAPIDVEAIIEQSNETEVADVE